MNPDFEISHSETSYGKISANIYIIFEENILVKKHVDEKFVISIRISEFQKQLLDFKSSSGIIDQIIFNWP